MNLKKSTMILLICSFIVLIIGITSCNYNVGYLEQVDYKNLQKKINDKNDFILFVSNKSCSHCKTFEPKLKNITNEYKVRVYKIDTATITNDEYNELTGLIGEIATPRVLFFYKGSESGTANRIDGDVDEDTIVKKLMANGYIKD